MWDAKNDDVVEPFRVSAGFIAFVAALFVPVIVGIAVFAGASLVSDEVYAAEASESRFANSPMLNGEPGEDVAGWKKSLVGLCPLH
jgi:hypothetical protein